MSDVFIAHMEKDADVALEIAVGLEEAGYTTWCYEVDSIPGPSYLVQTGKAVEASKAMVVVISPHSVGSRQVTREIVRAHESGKDFIPVLRNITHIEFQNRQPEWREAVGAAASIGIPLEGVAGIIPRIVSGLKALSIEPRSKSEAARIVQISKVLGELQRRSILGKTELPPVPVEESRKKERGVDKIAEIAKEEEKPAQATRMRFTLEKSAEHLEKGLKLESKGNLKEAKYNLLKAAEFLYKAAEKSEPSLKQKRIERADSILERTKSLDYMLARKSSPGTIPQAESAGAASEWMVFEKPNLVLSDVAGLEDVKEQIRIRMIYPFTHPELARRFGIKKGGGILLYGPPGTGKTMLAKAVAGEIDAAFFTVKPSEIMSKWVGEAEQNVAKLFSEARSHERAIIFIDEVESLIPKRSGSYSTVMQRVVPQILSEMEGFSSGRDTGRALLFMGATNEPWVLDEAVLRPGRFDEKVYVPLPDFDARLEILYSHLKDRPLSADISFDEITQMLEGYSGADIRRICEKACDIPFVESVKTGEERDVEKRDILSAMQQVKPSVSRQAIEKFDKFANTDKG